MRRYDARAMPTPEVTADCSSLPLEAVSVYVADGDAAGQDVPHVHIHLIPRRTTDGFGFRFPTGYGTLPERSELEATAALIARGR